jgi:hypothetical protein
VLVADGVYFTGVSWKLLSVFPNGSTLGFPGVSGTGFGVVSDVLVSLMRSSPEYARKWRLPYVFAGNISNMPLDDRMTGEIGDNLLLVTDLT